MNKYEESNGEVKIHLQCGRFCLIDAIDAPIVLARKWYSTKNRNIRYALSHDTRRTPKIRMHSFIIGAAPANLVIDHINGDGLDNRRSNLRFLTFSQNAFNSSMWPNNTSGRKGVSYHKRNKSWISYIKINGKLKSLGNYKNFEDAVAARVAAEAGLW